MLIFFDIMGTVHNEFILEGQTVNFAYYCDVLRQLRENVQRLHPNFWRQKNWLLHHGNALSHFLFHHGIFDQKHYRPHRSYFSLFARLTIKLRGHHFDTN
jgi:hypothetical protein